MTKNKQPKHLRLVASNEAEARLAYFRAMAEQRSMRSLPRAPRLATPRKSFALVPHDFAVELAKRKIGDAGWLLWFEIDRLVFSSRRNPVKFTNQRWKTLGLSRWTKARALRRLQKLGIITFAIRGQEAPEVTCLWRPLSGP
jgi:hypothetical protein